MRVPEKKISEMSDFDACVLYMHNSITFESLMYRVFRLAVLISILGWGSLWISRELAWHGTWQYAGLWGLVVLAVSCMRFGLNADPVFYSRCGWILFGICLVRTMFLGGWVLICLFSGFRSEMILAYLGACMALDVGVDLWGEKEPSIRVIGLLAW